MDNHYCVPDFEMDDDYFMPSTSGINRSKKSAIMEDEMMELLWQNGQVVTQKFNGGRKSRGGGGSGSEAANLNAEVEAEGERIRNAAEETVRQHVFMQEDEMASWLHYPFDEPEPEREPEHNPQPELAFDHRRDVYPDLIYPPPVNNKGIVAAPSREIRTSAPEIRPQPPQPPPSPPPPPPPTRRVDLDNNSMFQDFMNFARLPKEATAVAAAATAAASNSSKVVESNDTSMAVPAPRNSIQRVTPEVVRNHTNANEAAGRELTRRCEITVTSSPGCSAASASGSAERALPPPPQATAEDRKRKGREDEDNSVGVDSQCGDTKKQARGSITKKSRAAEVHNLSERKRRDRINEKMKALQELIPRCNKSDKASMLDEAIEYLKSLQLQVQMMSMGCSMVPMMYPGVQHYMPAMGMGMGMGMNQPMIQYPHVLPGSAMPNQAAAAAAHMGQRFPIPTFHMPPVPIPDRSTVQASNASDSMVNSTITHSVNQPQYSNFVDPYHQYLGLHQGQVSLPQIQAVVQTNTEKPSSSRKVSNPENHQPG